MNEIGEMVAGVRWFGRCAAFACAEGPDRSRPGFLRRLQSYRFGQRVGLAGLAGDYSADFIHPKIPMAIGGDRVRLT